MQYPLFSLRVDCVSLESEPGREETLLSLEGRGGGLLIWAAA